MVQPLMLVYVLLFIMCTPPPHPNFLKCFSSPHKYLNFLTALREGRVSDLIVENDKKKEV